MRAETYNKYQPQRIAEIAEAALTAKTLQEIEEKFGTSWNNLYRACRKNGITIKKQKKWLKYNPIKQQEPKIKVTPEILNEIKSCASQTKKTHTIFYDPPPRDVTASICGDPAPNRSALFKRNNPC